MLSMSMHIGKRRLGDWYGYQLKFDRIDRGRIETCVLTLQVMYGRDKTAGVDGRTSERVR